MKNLILFTCHFPYTSGESFIENEIPFLANKFDKIVILCLSYCKNEYYCCNIKNVSYYSLHMDSFFLKHFRIFALGLLHFRIPFRFKSLNEFLCGIYFRGCSYLIYKKSAKILNKIIVKSDKNMIYSYWLSVTALASIYLKNYYKKNYNLNIVNISRAHGGDLYNYRNPFKRIPFQKYCVEHLDFIFPCSKDGTDYLINLYPDYSKKIKTEYLGTLDKGINNSSQSTGIHFITCSNLIPLKRNFLFAEAFVALVLEGYDIFWDCFGSGPDYNKILNYIKKNGCSKRVTFHGQVTSSELFTFYRNNKIDFFVNVSLFEGLPVSIMEAISFGIPIIATDVGGTREIVNKDVGVLLNRDITVHELTRSISCVIHNKEMQDIMKINCRKTWENRFTAKKNYELFSSLLVNLLTNN